MAAFKLSIPYCIGIWGLSSSHIVPYRATWNVPVITCHQRPTKICTKTVSFWSNDQGRTIMSPFHIIIRNTGSSFSFTALGGAVFVVVVVVVVVDIVTLIVFTHHCFRIDSFHSQLLEHRLTSVPTITVPNGWNGKRRWCAAESEESLLLVPVSSMPWHHDRAQASSLPCSPISVDIVAK